MAAKNNKNKNKKKEGKKNIAAAAAASAPISAGVERLSMDLLAELLFSGEWLAAVSDLARLEVAAPRLIAAASAASGAVTFRATRVIVDRGLDWLRSHLLPPASVRLWDSVERSVEHDPCNGREQTIRKRNGRCYYDGPLAAFVSDFHIVGVGRNETWKWFPPRADFRGLGNLQLHFSEDGTTLVCGWLECYLRDDDNCQYDRLHNRQLHSSGDGPAKISFYGVGDRCDEFAWYANNKLHRAGGKPALIQWTRGVSRPDGRREWWVDGKRHRGGGRPAIENADGSREWWVDGKRHRGGGRPAVEYADGSREWWVDGQRDRNGEVLPLAVTANGDAYFGNQRTDGGPTVIRANGAREWYDDDDDGLLLTWGLVGGVRIKHTGRLLRAGGLPTRELPDGTCEWYDDHTQRMRMVKLPNGSYRFFNAQGEQISSVDKSTDPGAYAALKHLKRKAIKDAKKAAKMVAAKAATK